MRATLLFAVGLLCGAHATTLTDAIASGKEEECVQIVNTGVDVNEDAGGFKAIHFAANKGYERLIGKLISKGAGVNSFDATSQTALHHAAFAGHYQTVSFLLDQVPNPIQAYASHASITCYLLPPRCFLLVSARLYQSAPPTPIHCQVC